MADLLGMYKVKSRTALFTDCTVISVFRNNGEDRGGAIVLAKLKWKKISNHS
ncbi:MAG: hypothetical protein HYV28_12620 [Ignavibacteriales bacterium]|nr:hypothetical protein [Ignavibacteriales bacterium]